MRRYPVLSQEEEQVMIKEQEQTAHFDEAAWVAHVAATRARLYKAFGLVPRST